MNSARILADRARTDARIRLLEPGRIGLVAALNQGIDAARAELVARMDADDLMHPERLRLQRTDEIAANIYVESPLAHPSVMMRRELLRQIGGYADGPFPEDYELWLRMNRAGYRMAKLPRVLLCWHERETRASRVDPRYSRAVFDRLRAAFLARDPRVCDANELVIWGAGRKTRQRVRLLLEQGIRAAAWVDIDPRKIGRVVWDLPVHPPEWLRREPRPFLLVYVRRDRLWDDRR